MSDFLDQVVIPWILIMLIGTLVLPRLIPLLFGSPKKVPNKYRVDERAMCIVVRKTHDRDAFKPYLEIDPEHQDVVAYWEGYEVNVEGMPRMYSIQQWQRNKARDLCDKLNQLPKK